MCDVWSRLALRSERTRLFARVGRIWVFASLGLMLNLSAGCGSLRLHRAESAPPQGSRSTQAAQKAARLSQLQGEVMRLADQYVVAFAEGSDEFAAHMGAPRPRAQATFRKVNQATAAVTIAAGPNPQVNLLDLVVLISTTRIVQEDYWVAQVYGKPAEPLLEILKRQETNVWRLASERLTAPQVQELRGLIQKWREQSPPEKHYTAFLRFTEFATLLGLENASAGSLPSSVFSLLHVDPLAGLTPAVRQLEQTRLLAERAMYYGARLPILLEWRAELFLFNTLETPEARQLLSLSGQLEQLAQQLPTLVQQQREAAIRQLFEGVARERTNILASLIAQEQQVGGLLSQTRQTLATGTQTASALQGLVQSSEPLLQRLEEMKSKRSRPFDIREYDQALSNATAAAAQLNLLVQTTDRSLPQAVTGGKHLINRVFILAAALLLLFFVLLALYRWLSSRYFRQVP